MAVARLIDSHCHIDAAEFAGDRAAVIARARAVGVSAQVVPAVSRAGWPALAELVARYPDLWPAYGLHPCYLAEHKEEDLQALRGWLRTHPAVAVGECGLDRFEPGLDFATQLRFFRAQLEIASEFALPVIVHARRAVEEVELILRDFPQLKGVVHSFSGSLAQAERLWRRGFYTSFGGPLTYPRARRIRALVAACPAELLLLETDAPDQPPISRRGQRNEPQALTEILEEAARIRGESVEHLAALTAANARRLFRIPAPSRLA